MSELEKIAEEVMGLVTTLNNMGSSPIDIDSVIEACQIGDIEKLHLMKDRLLNTLNNMNR